MELILYYIKTSVSDLIPYIPLITLIRLVKAVYNVKRGRRLSLGHEAAALLFMYYMGALMIQTVSFKFIFDGSYVFDGNINLIPLKLAYRMLIYARTDVMLVNLLGNIAIFVPLGFFLPLLRTEFRTAFRTLAAGLSVSFFIEIVQLFTPRVTDIDDLILNTLGALVGYLLYTAIISARKCKGDMQNR